jgi:hypothetical protein
VRPGQGPGWGDGEGGGGAIGGRVADVSMERTVLVVPSGISAEGDLWTCSVTLLFKVGGCCFVQGGWWVVVGGGVNG